MEAVRFGYQMGLQRMVSVQFSEDARAAILEGSKRSARVEISPQG